MLNPSDQAPPPPAPMGNGLTLLEWSAHSKGSRRGFATIRLRNGLAIMGVTVCASHGKAWATLPSRPMLDSDGLALRDGAGKVRYAPMLEWSERKTAGLFSAAVIALVEASHPEALR